MRFVIAILLFSIPSSLVQAFTFTDVVAKMQRAQEYAKVAQRFGEFQGFAADTLGYMQSSLNLYHDVNRALQTADWTDFIPQIAYYEEDSTFDQYDLNYSDADGVEEVAKLYAALDAREALSPDLRAHLEEQIRRTAERASQERLNMEALNDIADTMKQRLVKLNDYQVLLRSISTGTGEANQTKLLTFLCTMMLEQSRQNQEIQALLLIQVRDRLSESIGTREYGVSLADLDRNAQLHNLQVMRELLSGKSQ